MDPQGGRTVQNQLKHFIRSTTVMYIHRFRLRQILFSVSAYLQRSLGGNGSLSTGDESTTTVTPCQNTFGPQYIYYGSRAFTLPQCKREADPIFFCCGSIQGPRYRGFTGPWPPQKFSVVAAVNLYSFLTLVLLNIR